MAKPIIWSACDLSPLSHAPTCRALLPEASHKTDIYAKEARQVGPWESGDKSHALQILSLKLLAILLAAILVACTPQEIHRTEMRSDGTTAFTGDAMTMQYKILIGQILTSSQANQAAMIIKKTFHDTDTIFNKWNPDSEISKLNAQKSGSFTPLSPELLHLFMETDLIVRLSQGKFDPTIEPLQELWKQKLKQGTTPSEKEIQEIAPAIGWDKISFSDGLFNKQDDRTKLDFGGIAKGLCIDMLVDRLKEAGFPDIYVEWGGEIRAAGRHPEGRPWTIYISRLQDTHPDHAITTLQLDNQAIATSGDYLQSWTIKKMDSERMENDVTYFHIFDPKTLKPMESTSISIASASVVAPTCSFADGLATVAMMFSSVDEAAQWAEMIKEHYPDVSFWIISRSD